MDFNLQRLRNCQITSMCYFFQAIKECKNSLRFMILYLHNPSHESGERFVRETLFSYQMKQFLDRNEILLWGVSVRSQEGYKGTIKRFGLKLQRLLHSN